jgi:non-canonical (house-cleaning) NTP pyrophosphatase
MKIAIWTTKTPKVEGVKQAVKECPYFFWEEIEYILQQVSSDISDMPLSIEETMQWAKNRAQNIKKLGIKADFYVWIEGWTTKIWDKKYLFWTIFIENDKGEWHFGFSWMIEVPKKVEEMLYEEWKELWPIMSELSGITNIQSQNWSMWAWSDDMLTRKDEFVTAFKSAISPFFNEFYKK